ncbi:hypothetical protein G6F36_013917 [Rhizopus arrhizus]|nr:hypothetical protein G6F36_013917 [Rhizopus arrhizus]
MLLPNPILQHIFSYLNYPERWQVARVCRQWYWMIHDPYLYQHLCFQDLELKALLVSLQKIIRIAPRPKSIRFQHCYSSFIQDTLIPVSFSRCDAPPLYTHIRHLQPAARRPQYQAYGFDTVHQAFSDQFAKLMQLGPHADLQRSCPGALSIRSQWRRGHRLWPDASDPHPGHPSHASLSRPARGPGRPCARDRRPTLASPAFLHPGRRQTGSDLASGPVGLAVRLS